MKQIYMREALDMVLKTQGMQALQDLVSQGQTKVTKDGLIPYLLIDHNKEAELIQKVLDRK
jgi:hypothetical protein